MSTVPATAEDWPVLGNLASSSEMRARGRWGAASRFVAVGCALCAGAVGAACASTSGAGRLDHGASSSSPTEALAAAPGSALSAVDRVVVKGRAPKTGYRRDAFGAAWSDVDRNGCDTRNDILNRDLTDKTWRDGSHGCVVTGGVLNEPYTRRTVRFVKADAAAVQIDHVVALSDAWQTGASFWDDDRRTRFANDPANLLAVDGPTNEAKGDADAASWLPPNKAYRCAYVARQVSVKLHWQLWATPAERAAFARVLTTCPAQPLPNDASSTGPSSPQPSASGGPSTARAVYYANCAAARAAGAAPLHRGAPGYRAALDGDGDGLACE